MYGLSWVETLFREIDPCLKAFKLSITSVNISA